MRPSRDRRLRAPGLFVLAGKEGLKRRPPFPAPYPPLTGAHRKEKVSSRKAARLSRACSGSSRTGIKPQFWAHPALESKFISRLIYGLENALPLHDHLTVEVATPYSSARQKHSAGKAAS